MTCKTRYLLILLVTLLPLFVKTVSSARQVTIEFVYSYPIDSPCPSCVQEIIDDYLIKNLSLNDVQSEYGSRLVINRVDYHSDQGSVLRQLYQINALNTLVIRSDDGFYTKLETMWNGTYEDLMRQIIDTYLVEQPALNKGILECHAKVDSDEMAANITIVESGYTNQTPFADFFDPGNYTVNATWNGVAQAQAVTIVNGTRTTVTFVFNATSSGQESLVVALATAFTVGFFETFSPCLIALLSFILSYTIGEMDKFRGSMLRVMIFAAGFLSAAMVLATATLLMLFSVQQFYVSMMWGVSVVGLLFGLNLLGLDFARLLRIDLNTKPLVRNLARRYAFSLTGLGLLGFLFYFLDPCLAPVLVVAHITKFPEYATSSLIVFAIGVLVPFVAMGILAGSISKLVRSTYRYKSMIRAVSGCILIGYSIWLIYGLFVATA